jgi:predicted O-linked N-acetylglucosamine transferase (SPINDLY family)
MNNLELSKKYFELGLLQFEKSRFLEAENNFNSALKLAPGRLSILTNLSATLIKSYKYEDAQVLISEILKIFPDDPITHLNQGNLYFAINNMALALSSFSKSVNLDPNYPEAHNNFGFALYHFGHYKDALIQFDLALNIYPEYVEALYNKTLCLIKINNYKNALDILEYALKLNNKFDDLLITYVGLLQQTCEWKKLNSSLENLLNLIYSENNISSVFRLLGLFDDPVLHKYAAIKYSDKEFKKNKSLEHIFVKAKKDVIKIGYFSADFHNHATTYLMAELFELHDKSKFEIHAFSYGPNVQDSMRERISKSFNFFHEVSKLSDENTVQLSRKLEIDIAVDLKGYTYNCRPNIFAKRAAPIQVNYLGYPGTMGNNYYDYIIADPIVIPYENQIHFSEKIIYLPDCYQVNDSRKIIALINNKRIDENIPDNSFVFCCFNNIYKILPDIFYVWMDILKKVDNSVLWLLDDNPIAKQNLIIEAERKGVCGNRLIFAVRKGLEEHLARHHLADLFLDTLPYNAHTTASDALWAGLPVLTCTGNSFASRVSASLLNAIRIPELITNNLVDYQNTAIELSNNPNKLNNIKQKLINNRLSTPLFNTKQFTENIEQAYTKIFDIYTSNQPIRNIII